jgi:hypothetical protein
MDGFDLTPRCAPALPPRHGARQHSSHQCVCHQHHGLRRGGQPCSCCGQRGARVRPGPSPSSNTHPGAPDPCSQACVSAPVRTGLTSQGSSQGRSPFAPSEAAVLEQALALSPEDFATLLCGAADAFRAAAASGTNAQVRAVRRPHRGSSCLTLPSKQGLAERVTAAGGTNDAVSCFRDTWRSGSAAALNALRAADWGSADTLRAVNWRVSVPLASDSAQGAPPASPVATFELTVGRAGHAHVGAASRRIAFECTQEQLGRLFDDVERIQAQLDALGQQQ